MDTGVQLWQRLVGRHQSFIGTYCLHLQGSIFWNVSTNYHTTWCNRKAHNKKLNLPMYFVAPEAHYHVNSSSLFDCIQSTFSNHIFFWPFLLTAYRQQSLKSVSSGFLTKFCMQCFPLRVICCTHVTLLWYNHRWTVQTMLQFAPPKYSHSYFRGAAMR